MQEYSKKMMSTGLEKVTQDAKDENKLRENILRGKNR
jgi:hypothetical protein